MAGREASILIVGAGAMAGLATATGDRTVVVITHAGEGLGAARSDAVSNEVIVTVGPQLPGPPEGLSAAPGPGSPTSSSSVATPRQPASSRTVADAAGSDASFLQPPAEDAAAAAE